MRILIDINHPAHVHYFRNFIKLMEAKGHEFCVINRDSEMINQLLDYYGIAHVIRNKRPKKKGVLPSLMNLAWMTMCCIRKSFSFHPDMYVGFASSACAITSRLFRKSCILMDDTEHNSLNHKIYLPACSAVLTPFYFSKDLQPGCIKSKQVRFDAYVEQLYLHSDFYHPNDNVLKELSLEPHGYAIVRYIAYDAHHDLAVHPLDAEAKKEIVVELSKYCRVFVSLEEGGCDPFYEPYALNISPEKMHDLEANAKLMVTEGATMASESFIHGVPYIYLNPLKCGNIDYQCDHYPDRAFQSTDVKEVINAIGRIVDTSFDAENARNEAETQTINPTRFLEWFVENYQSSKHIMGMNPNYQYNFR